MISVKRTIRSSPPLGFEVADELRAAAHDSEGIDRILERENVTDLDVRHAVRHRLPPLVAERILRSKRFSSRPMVLGALAVSPTTPVTAVLSILGGLGYRDLALAATAAELAPAVRQSAEGVLLDMLPSLRLGDRISLARLCPRRVAMNLLSDSDARVRMAALDNPRLREQDLATAVEAPEARPSLAAEVLEVHRWKANYVVRRAIVRGPNTPRSVALSLISALQPLDLKDLAENPPRTLHPLLIRAAAVVLTKMQERESQ